MCPQDNACTEEAPEGGDKMDIRSMSGLFVSVAVVMFAAFLQQVIRWWRRPKSAMKEAMTGEKVTADEEAFEDATW